MKKKQGKFSPDELKKIPLIAPWCLEKAPEKLKQQAMGGKLTQAQAKAVAPGLTKNVRGAAEDRIERYLLTAHNEEVLNSMRVLAKAKEKEPKVIEALNEMIKDLAFPGKVLRKEARGYVVQSPDGMRFLIKSEQELKAGQDVFYHQEGFMPLTPEKAEEYRKMYLKTLKESA